MPQMSTFESISLKGGLIERGLRPADSTSQLDIYGYTIFSALFILYQLSTLRRYYIRSNVCVIVIVYFIFGALAYLSWGSKVSDEWFIGGFLAGFVGIWMVIRYQKAAFFQDRLEDLIPEENVILSGRELSLKMLIKEAKDYVAQRYRPRTVEGVKRTARSDYLSGKNTFAKELAELMRVKGMTEQEVRLASHIDRSLMTQIQICDLRGKPYYPSYKTIFALAIGLRLNLSETEKLLGSAGQYLSEERKFDVVMEYIIERQLYDIPVANEILKSQKCSTFPVKLVAMQLGRR